MIIIGLCGGSGSGKGTVAELFKSYKIPSIDADELYHSLIKPGCQLTLNLEKEFGSSIISTDGNLNRKKLADIVFSDNSGELQKKLNSVTHRAVINAAEEIIEKYRIDGMSAVVFDAPLLFESGFDKKCDIILAVIADDDIRIRRIVERDNISKEEAERRIHYQKSNSFLKSNSDYVIFNNGDINELKIEFDKIIKNIQDRGK